MFTGIIQGVGTIAALHLQQQTAHLRIETSLTDANSQIGDSVAVNGICLTITALAQGWFETTVMPETVRRTALADYAEGTPVDLELALAANGRIDGHFVLGHVDSTAQLLARVSEQNAVVMRFELPVSARRFVVEKGSIAINGISLTVSAVDHQSFGVSLIPHTLTHTMLDTLQVGQRVNIETDILGKYIIGAEESYE